jgi:dienelactone hydrolase
MRHRLAAVLLVMAFAPGVRAAIPASLHTAGAEGEGCVVKTVPDTTPPAQYLFCDDGIPQTSGGTTPNVGGLQAVTVPAEYDGYEGLPPKKIPTTVGGADANGDIALDVNVSWPMTPPPAGGYPLLFFMHGCCGGNKSNWEAADYLGTSERWHYSNAWFASRGYVVVTYTSRGFGKTPNSPAHPLRRGSTGETQIQSRRFEINDYQSLACQIYSATAEWADVLPQAPAINPERIVVTGGSYGGGFSWMALTDPIWSCGTTRMKLAAAAPRYGWTDLVYSLVPTGRHSVLPTALPQTDGCDSGGRKADGTDCTNPVPAGVPKQTINAGLYGTGTAGTGPDTGAATFPQSIHLAQTCLTGPYPVETNPACADTLATTLPEFIADRSAYYQQQWFDRIASDPEYRIPVFSAATFTDPLFPPHEHRRMHNRIRSIVPGYPLQAYFGDYQHFVQNKPKEWADLCGADRHVCTNADFADDFDEAPATLARTGITTRLNRFVDYYAKPRGVLDVLDPAPASDVTAALQVCPQKATATQAADEPGETFTAATFEALATGTLVLDTGGAQPSLTAGSTGLTLTSAAGGAAHADPVATNQTAAQNPHKQCSTRLASDPAPAGVAQLTTAVLGADVVMLGAGQLTVAFEPGGDSGSVQLNARLYEVLPDGSAVMADRGFRRLSAAEVAAKTISFELFGNGWRFTQGNRIRLELAQDDSPYLKASQPPSSLTVTRATLTLPTRSGSSGGGSSGGSGGGGGGGALAFAVLGGLLGILGLRRWRRRP